MKSKENIHHYSINQLEYHMSQFSPHLESKLQEKYVDHTMMNAKANNSISFAVLTRSRKSIVYNVKENVEAKTSKEGYDIGLEKSDQSLENDIPKEVEESPKLLTTEDLRIF